MPMLDRTVVLEVAALYPKEYDESLVGSAALSRRLHQQSRLEKEDLLEIVRWKSPRALPKAEKNPYWLVRIASAQAFECFDLGLGLWNLCYLEGVSVRMASAIMAAYDPDQYTVLDVRAWGALDRLGLLKPLGFQSYGSVETVSLDDCRLYRPYAFACRHLAFDIEVDLRTLDRCLWVIGQRDDERGWPLTTARSAS